MASTSCKAEEAPATTADIQYEIANTIEQRAAAFRLVYRSYIEAGLGEPNPYGMRVTPYHLVPSTEMFVATLRQEVIFTVSLVADGDLGLPMEAIYGEEVMAKRAQGLRLGEVSCLADRRSDFRGSFPVFLRLARLMVQHARYRGLDQILLAIHPRHVRFYRRFMACEPLAGERVYPTVRNHPAVALCLDFDRIDRERPENYDTFFGEPLPEEALKPHPITPAEADFFRPMVDPGFRVGPLPSQGCSPQQQPEEAVGAA